jgi:hypothetical protein
MKSRIPGEIGARVVVTGDVMASVPRGLLAIGGCIDRTDHVVTGVPEGLSIHACSCACWLHPF